MAHISISGLNAKHTTTISQPNTRSQNHKITQSSSTALQNAVAEVNKSLADKPNAAEILEKSSFSLIRPKGEPFNLYQDQPELREKAKALAERLDGPIHDANAGHAFYQDSMRDFLKAGVLTDPEFLDMAASMTDDELADFAVTIKAMVLPASSNYTISNEAGRSYKDKVTEFVEVLKNSDASDREAILTQSASYAAEVDVDDVVSFEKNVFGQIPTNVRFAPYRSDSSSNNLHNYISAVVATDDPAALTDQLAKMSDDAQQGLLSVYGLDTELGNRLAQLAGPEGNGLPTSLLSALGSMADSVKIGFFFSDAKVKFGQAWFGDEALSKDNEESQSREFALDSITSMVSMLEQYDFSGEQLETMGSELNGLSNPDKRAYIEITATGLDDMLQSKVDENFDKKNVDEALEVVSNLRSNKNVLSLVNGARYHDVTLIERPDIEEGLTVVALEGAAVFRDLDTAIGESRLLLDALPERVNMVNGHSEKGDDESKNLYSAKTFDRYKQDAGNLVSTLVAFETMRDNSTASDKTSLDDFTKTLTDMHSAIRDETLSRVNDELETGSLRDKATKNTQFAFFSSLLQQMAFETQRDFENMQG